jgi:4-alpha-glucanotransferase
VADTAVAPMQDVLGLGAEARLNTPGTATGNWEWRCTDLPGWAARRLRDLAEAYGRVEDPEAPAR